MQAINSSLNLDRITSTLSDIIGMELASVVSYSQCAVVAAGRDRLSMSALFKGLADAALDQAQEAGDLLIALNERPSIAMSPEVALNQPSTLGLLNHAIARQQRQLVLYQTLFDLSRGSQYLEAFAIKRLAWLDRSAQSLAQMVARQHLEAQVCLPAWR